MDNEENNVELSKQEMKEFQCSPKNYMYSLVSSLILDLAWDKIVAAWEAKNGE